MHVIVEVVTGPYTGRKIELRPGGRAIVGRTQKAPYPIPADALLSSRHFMIECTATECRIRDLKSSHGTYVNEQPIAEAILSNGDQILAGSTAFVVHIGVGEPAASSVPSVRADRGALDGAPRIQARGDTLEERMLGILRGPLQPLYAVLDAARAPKVLELVEAAQDERQSLYEGVQAEVLREYAPYLVQLPAESSLLETLAWEGWGESWGVYVTCRLSFQEVRRHLRHFLLVKGPQGQDLYFRFYDPRVLRTFLPVCNTQDAIEFFGPVTSYAMESEDAQALLRFSSSPHGATQEKILLETGSQSTGEADAASPLSR